MIHLGVSAQGIFNSNTLSTAILLPEDDINTKSFEFAPVFFGEYIAFVYDKGNSLYYDEEYDTPYFDLAFAAKNTLGNLARKASFIYTLSSEYQQGPFCFFNENQSILFTRTDPESGVLKIYKSDHSEAGWSEAEVLTLLGDGYHVCHPSISEDGNHLVFAAANVLEGSNMDLYTATKTNGQWSGVERLVSASSTSNDWFPRFVGDSIITYASGAEDLNIYAIKRNGEGWSPPEMAPPPINSSHDDFGLIVQDGIAYFSSNRPSNKGKDDLYRIEYKGSLFSIPEVEPEVPISILVQDKLTLQPIPDVNILVTPTVSSIDDVDLSKYQIDLIPQTDGQGGILLKLKPKESGPSQAQSTDSNGIATIFSSNIGSYLLEMTHPEYTSFRTIFEMKSMGTSLTLVMEPLPIEEVEETGIEIPTTSGSVIVFENIYYDFNSHIILEGAATELEALATAMSENPNMMVQLAAHTDSRGTKLYNQRLSEKRAASARDYLINKGINPSRITSLGYGESQLRNDCKDGVPCSEDQHRFNRRTEVKILSN